MQNDKVIVPFDALLNEKDTEIQTFGCRQSNPNICGNNNLSNVCAFVREDGICKMPSRAWKKQFHVLLSKQWSANDDENN